jgi:hypothetical protein
MAKVPGFERVVHRLQETIGSGPPVLRSYDGVEIPWLGTELVEWREIDGKEVDFHLLKRSLGLWIVTAAFDTEGNLIVVTQLKYGVNEVTVQFSPGGVKYPPQQVPTESQLIQLGQEGFTQETGYGKGDWTYLGSVAIDDNKLRDITGQHGLSAHLLMAVDVVKQGTPQPKSTDFYEVVKIPPQDFPQLLASPFFRETSAVACLHKALLHRGIISWNQ